MAESKKYHNLILHLHPKTINEAAEGRYKMPFEQCALEQREMILDNIAKSRDEKHIPARTMINQLRSRIIKAFYSTPVSWEMLAFTAPYPGGYPDFNKPPPN